MHIKRTSPSPLSLLSLSLTALSLTACLLTLLSLTPHSLHTKKLGSYASWWKPTWWTPQCLRTGTSTEAISKNIFFFSVFYNVNLKAHERPFSSLRMTFFKNRTCLVQCKCSDNQWHFTDGGALRGTGGDIHNSVRIHNNSRDYHLFHVL